MRYCRFFYTSCLVILAVDAVPVYAGGTGLSGCLFRVLNAIVSGGPKSSEIKWVTTIISDAQYENLQKFAARANRPLKAGYRVEVLTGDEIRLRATPGQFIEKNSAQDWLLLADSRVDVEPREVFRFRLHLRNGEVVDPGIQAIGNSRYVDLDEAKSELFNLLKGNVSGIDEIELVHTHPYHSVRITDLDEKQYFRPVELSDQDIALAADYVHRFPQGMRIKIKAVTPSGFSFSQTFMKTF